MSSIILIYRHKFKEFPSMNEHVFEYCKSYITSEKSPQFAIFIKGKWGCGKTFFINKLLESLDSEELKSRVMRISLYGVSSTDEIDIKMFEALHPVLSSKGAKIVGTVIKTALRLGPSLSIFDDNKSLSIDMSNILNESNDSKGINADNKIIVVDDFERALIPSETILGYFSNLISDTDNRVIFIGNEEKVESNDYFKKIKEKTIGVEFNIVPDFESAIDCFLSEVLNEDKSVSQPIKNSLKEITTILKCDNLRIIRQAIYNFSLLVKCLPAEINYSETDLTKIFFVLFIQKSLGLISENEVRNAISVFFYIKIDYDTYKKEKKKHKNDSFWDSSLWFSYESVLSDDVWKEMIFNGRYIKKEIDDDYRKYLEREKDSKPNSLFRLFNWYDLSSEEFSQTYEKVHEGFKGYKFLEPGEIIHYIQLMDRLINLKMIPMEEQELEAEVNAVLDSGKVLSLSPDQCKTLLSSSNYKNYGFSDFENAWYKDSIEKLRKVCVSKYLVEIKKEFQNKLNSDDDILELCGDFISNTGSQKYSDVPILSLLEENDLVKLSNKLSDLKPRDINTVIYCIKTRYGVKSVINRILLGDYDNFCKLIRMIEKKMSTANPLYNPSYYRLESMLEELNNVKSSLEEKLKKNY